MKYFGYAPAKQSSPTPVNKLQTASITMKFEKVKNTKNSAMIKLSPSNCLFSIQQSSVGRFTGPETGLNHCSKITLELSKIGIIELLGCFNQDCLSKAS
jgi:hypothetical protein